MFCPRCGRPIKETANFCGGCGLSKSEIENYIKTKSNTEIKPETTPVTQPIEEINSEINNAVVNEISNENIIDIQPECVECENTQQDTTSAQTNTYTNPQQEQNYSKENPQPAVCEKSQNVSTFDFFLTMVIAGIPIIGLIYLVYLAIQDNNVNKRSFARASLLMLLFTSIIGIMFFVGILFSALI